MFLEEFDRLERRLDVIQEELNLLEIITLTDDLPTLREAARLGLEALKANRTSGQEPDFRPDFDLEWDVGMGDEAA